MLCEECGLNPAVFRFIAISGTERTEKNLCPSCMLKYQQNLPGVDVHDLAGLLSNLFEDKETRDRDPFEYDFPDMECENCGMTFKEFKKNGTVGCMNCYKAFRDPVMSYLQRVHGATQHAGRVPGGIHSGTSIRIGIEKLRQQLAKAVAEEEYEQAAKYRDAIRAMKVQLDLREKSIHVAPPKRIDKSEEDASCRNM